jgi:hypothetical protein
MRGVRGKCSQLLDLMLPEPDRAPPVALRGLSGSGFRVRGVGSPAGLRIRVSSAAEDSHSGLVRTLGKRVGETLKSSNLLSSATRTSGNPWAAHRAGRPFAGP